jgi:hypothetical protein
MVTRRSRPSGKSMIGLSGFKAYSAAELATLRDDVASLSASVGDLVRREAAAATGLDQTVAASRLKLEEKANEAVDHIKGVMVRMSVVAALAVAAAIFALLALITGLVALYVRLEPAYGVFQALGIVGGVLAVIALVLISAAMIVGPRENKFAAPLTKPASASEMGRTSHDRVSRLHS